MGTQIEPFGYFRALPFGWEDCSSKDDGAVALYEQSVVDSLLLENDRLKKTVESGDELISELMLLLSKYIKRGTVMESIIKEKNLNVTA